MVNRPSQRQVISFLFFLPFAVGWLATLHFLDATRWLVEERNTKKCVFVHQSQQQVECMLDSALIEGQLLAFFWIFQTCLWLKKLDTHLRRLSSVIRSVACYSLRKRLDPLNVLQEEDQSRNENYEWKCHNKNWIKITYSIRTSAIKLKSREGEKSCKIKRWMCRRGNCRGSGEVATRKPLMIFLIPPSLIAPSIVVFSRTTAKAKETI